MHQETRGFHRRLRARPGVGPLLSPIPSALPSRFPPASGEGRVDAASRHPVYPVHPVHPCFVLGSVLPGVWSLVLTLHPEAGCVTLV